MKLYDEWIEKCHRLLEGWEGIRLPIGDQTWPDAGEHQWILRHESAYELGKDTLPAVSGLGVTSSPRWFDGDEIWRYGPDLYDIPHDAPYARLAFVRVAENGPTEDQRTYALVRNIEYTKYHVHPKGFMPRISAANEREPVRVSRKALAEGLDFAGVGQLYVNRYHRDPNVTSVKLVFITLPDFPYPELERLVRHAQHITLALDHIAKNVTMDCKSCHLKDVCEEVEGMRELHFTSQSKAE